MEPPELEDGTMLTKKDLKLDSKSATSTNKNGSVHQDKGSISSALNHESSKSSSSCFNDLCSKESISISSDSSNELASSQDAVLENGVEKNSGESDSCINHKMEQEKVDCVVDEKSEEDLLQESDEGEMDCDTEKQPKSDDDKDSDAGLDSSMSDSLVLKLPVSDDEESSESATGETDSDLLNAVSSKDADDGDIEMEKIDAPGLKEPPPAVQGSERCDSPNNVLVFDQNDLKPQSGNDNAMCFSSMPLEESKDSNKENTAFTGAIFEDITEDEDSEEEHFENIELEVDDLIDANDNSKSSGSSDKEKANEEIVGKNYSAKTEEHEGKVFESTKPTSLSNENLECSDRSTKLFSSPKTVIPDHEINSSTRGESIEVDCQESKLDQPVRKKSTARKSVKPVTQFDSAPLKRINMHPIKNVTMSLSEVEEALNYNPLKDADSSKKVTQKPFSPSPVLEHENSNTYHVVSVTTKQNLAAKKKRGRKNTYNFPGFKRKHKKLKLSDDVISSGASSVDDSISLSDGDMLDSDIRENDYSLSDMDLKHFDKFPENHMLDKHSVLVTPSSTVVTTTSSILTVSPPSSSSSSTTSSSSSKFPLQGKSKGSNKMNSVLEMLHERNRQKAAQDDGKGPTPSSTISTTTTTILVSPPANKPIVEGLKRKGTPRKRKGKKLQEVKDISTSAASIVNSQLPKSVTASTSQSPVVMVVAQHSSAPGLRSLLPRNMVVSPAHGPSNVLRPSGAGLLTSIPMVSTLPKSMANLPAGVTALPLTSLPPGSTIFTAVPGTQPLTAVSASSLLNLNSAKSPNCVSNTSKQFKSKVTSASPMKNSLPAQMNSDSLRALLVGKSNVVSNTPVVFHMLNQTPTTHLPGTTFIPIQGSPMIRPMSHGLAKPTHVSESVPTTKSNSLTHLKSHHSIPNGVSCLTPPKTPDTDCSSEVAVAASLTRPVTGQVEDSEKIPLCCCTINMPSFNKLSSGVTYCQALDSVDNKVLGCCNKVTSSQLVRPGVKIPFMAVCEVHRKRLRSHQCCPGCGHFCSQGKFQQCKKEGKSSVHLFHKQCMFYRGSKYYCPHCGEETGQYEVDLKLNDDSTSSTASRATKRDTERKASARFCITKTPTAFEKSKSTSDPKKTINVGNKSICTDILPLGPDQAIYTKLKKCLTEDRPKKYRILPKDLYTPSCEGDVEKVFYMLVDGVQPNSRHEDYDDQTPMHAAATCGNLGIVFLLQQYGAEIHAQDKNLRTPMICAAENGHPKVVQFLLVVGANTSDRGEDGMTSLHYAAKAGYLDIIRLLLETLKVDVNIQDDGGWTPIVWATESQLPDVVRYLISQGGNPNLKDNEENTGLHWAAFSGSLEIAQFFLELGCEIDSPNEHGDRPVHIAARQDHYEIIVLLLARGADVDLKNEKDETPVECCVNKSGQVWMALKVNQQLRSFAARKLIQPERFLERDISMGREKNPIACVNAEDNEPSPSDYLYIVENVETYPLNINRVITSLQSCRCKDECSSMYCVCGRNSIKCSYDKSGKLVEDFNFLEPPLLFECNRACRCWVNCNNRVVQNGIMCRLQMFRTNGRGWGIRTLMDIPKGTFVCEYIGELISDSEADRREDDSYLFDLDNKDGDTYCIDARKYGNLARFINHLCEPNLIPVKVFVEHQDLRFPRICFFSSKDIAAYEELGFDYGEKFWIIKWKHFTCACKSPRCKYSKDTIQKTLEDYKLRYPDEPLNDA